MALILTLLPPLILATLLGWQTGRTLPEDRSDFFRTVGITLLWCAMITFIWQALWVSAWVPAPWTDTVRSAFNLTAASALIWGPLLVIAYILRAMRERKV